MKETVRNVYLYDLRSFLPYDPSYSLLTRLELLIQYPDLLCTEPSYCTDSAITALRIVITCHRCMPKVGLVGKRTVRRQFCPVWQAASVWTRARCGVHLRGLGASSPMGTSALQARSVPAARASEPAISLLRDFLMAVGSVAATATTAVVLAAAIAATVAADYRRRCCHPHRLVLLR